MEQLWMDPNTKQTPQSILTGCVTFTCAQIAVRRHLEQNEGLEPRVMSETDAEVMWAGFSAGMYPGTWASGALRNYKKFIGLVQKRADCMGMISFDDPCMMKIEGNVARIEKILQECGIEISLDHDDDIVMVGGYPDDIERAHKTIIEIGDVVGDVNAKKIEGVKGPYHTRAFEWVAKYIFKPILRKVRFRRPKQGTLISNVTADALSGRPKELKVDLTQQLYKRVRWKDMMKRWAFNLTPDPETGDYIPNQEPVDVLAVALGPGGRYFIKLLKRAGYNLRVLDLSDERRLTNTNIECINAST